MKKYICRNLFLIFLISMLGSTLHAEQKNILFIPVDDLMPMLGSYGDEKILTPNIDRLAEQGTVFLNNACQMAVCGPSRASIMTGLYPDKTGVWDLQTKMRDVNPDVLTLPQFFKEQGYVTTGLGKTFDGRCVDNLKDHDAPSWSIPYASIPENRSMAHWQDYVNTTTIEAGRKTEAALAGRVFHPNYLKYMEFAKIGGPLARPSTEAMDVPDDAYSDGAKAVAAMKTLDLLAGKKKPFFLSVGFQKPHLPFAAPKKYWDLYDREKIELAEFREPPEGTPRIALKGFGGASEL